MKRARHRRQGRSLKQLDPAQLPRRQSRGRELAALTGAEVEHSRTAVLADAERFRFMEIARTVGDIAIGRVVNDELGKLRHVGRDGQRQEQCNHARLHDRTRLASELRSVNTK